MVNLSKVDEFDTEEQLREYIVTNLKRGGETLGSLIEQTRAIMKQDPEVDNFVKLLSVPIAISEMNVSQDDLAFIVTAAVVHIIALEPQK